MVDGLILLKPDGLKSTEADYFWIALPLNESAEGRRFDSCRGQFFQKNLIINIILNHSKENAMSSFKKIQKMCDELGVQLDNDKELGAFYLYSPKGHYFASHYGLTTLMIKYTEDGRSFKREAYREIEEYLTFGVEPVGEDEDITGWWD